MSCEVADAAFVRWVAAVVSILLGLLGEPPAVLGEETLRLGAWNIEWLGTPGNRTGTAEGVAQNPGDIADYIRAAGVDVLALEEITDDDDPLHWVIAGNAPTIRVSNRTPASMSQPSLASGLLSRTAKNAAALSACHDQPAPRGAECE